MGGIALVGVLALTICVESFSVNEIRVGGPLYTRDKQMMDLMADVQPPVVFIIEPFLVAIADG